MNPLVPAMTALMVVFWPVTFVAVPPTVMTGVGAPLPRVSTLARLPPLSSVHWFDCVVASLNFNCPMVRDESRLTVVSAVMFSVEKSARLPEPSATVPPVHLVVSLHSPLVVELHVPLAALATEATLAAANAALTAATAGMIRPIRLMYLRPLCPVLALCITRPSLSVGDQNPLRPSRCS